LRNNEVFFANCARVLRPGGALIHTFPCKFAPFSLVNQFLPNALARRLLACLHPQWKEECGFPAFYDRCYFSAVQQLLERNGFRDPRFAFRYYQSIYFDFFLPLYALMLLYDLTCWMMGVRNLACAILVTAERPPGNAGDVAKVPHMGGNSRVEAAVSEVGASFRPASPQVC
jgi:SAM-dependent methyltransferase